MRCERLFGLSSDDGAATTHAVDTEDARAFRRYVGGVASEADRARLEAYLGRVADQVTPDRRHPPDPAPVLDYF